MSNEYVHFNNNAQPAINEDNLNRMQQLIKQDINGAVAGDTLPIGAFMPYAGAVAPTNWLICDGSAISRTTYQDLFNVIGTTFGAGDGSTTFNLPDMRLRAAVGVDTRDSDLDAVGKTYGEKKHTMTINELVSHTHREPIDGGTSSGDYLSYGGYGNTRREYVLSGATGGSQPFNVMQPSMATNFIIKAFQTAGVVAQVVNEYSTSTTDVYSCNYINSRVDVSSLITKSSKVGTVYLKQAYKKGNRVYFSAQFEILQEGAELFTIDSSLKPIYAEVGNGTNYQAGASVPMIVKVSANGSSIDSNVYASSVLSYAAIHIEWEV